MSDKLELTDNQVKRLQQLRGYLNELKQDPSKRDIATSVLAYLILLEKDE